MCWYVRDLLNKQNRVCLKIVIDVLEKWKSRFTNEWYARGRGYQTRASCTSGTIRDAVPFLGPAGGNSSSTEGVK